MRVLRVLALESVPVGLAELAELAELQARGMKRVVDTLEDAGIVESVGRGSRKSYRIRAQVPFVNALQTLFVQERERAKNVLGELHNIVQSYGSTARAAWIEGPVATGEDRMGDAMVLVVLASDSDDEALRRNLRARLNDIQVRFDVPVELRVVHQADLEALSPEDRAMLDQARSVAGPPPRHFLDPLPDTPARSGETRSHAGRDAQLLDRAHTVADQIARDPSVIGRAKRWIEERRTVASPGEQVELQEWYDILTTMSPGRVRRLLTQTGERGTRLRQSMPFVEEAP